MRDDIDPEMEWTEQEMREIRALADSIAAVRLAQLAAFGFAIWYACHGDWWGVAVVGLVAGFLQMIRPRHRPDLARKAERLMKRDG